MRKLRLDPEDLRVESFAAVALDARAGTVWGHGEAGSIRDSCGGRTCDTLVCVCLVSQNASECASSCC